MEKTVIEKSIAQYKSIEQYAHISFDDVMNKVSQEIAELIEAKQSWNQEETYKEASDVLINLLSISSELNIAPLSWEKKDSDINSLIINFWKWNSKIQELRNRYSREETNISEVEKITKSLVSEVLAFTNPELSIEEILKEAVCKFESRKDLYKPKIDLKDFISSYQNFPKSWINFKDISPLLANNEALNYAIFEMANNCRNTDVIVWLDARWFIFWTLIAKQLNKPFVMIRKAWKLPWKTKEISYWLEYWNDKIQIQENAILEWQKVALIDDLLATWGTIKAAIDLVELSWWIVDNLSFVISLDEENLKNLDSRKVLNWYKINSLLNYN